MYTKPAFQAAKFVSIEFDKENRIENEKNQADRSFSDHQFAR